MIDHTDKNIEPIDKKKKHKEHTEKIIKEIEVFLDSNLVVEQVNKNFKVKAGNLKVLNSKVDDLIQEFNFIEINHVYREENKRADQLANMALDK